MIGLKAGVMTDSLFIRDFVAAAKERSSGKTFKIAIKPAASANVGMDFKWLVDVLNNNDLQARYLDTLDEKEKREFNAVSLQGVLNKQMPEMVLPGDNKLQSESAIPVDSNTLTVLLFGENGIYIYSGNNIISGKRYRYGELEKFFLMKRSKSNFSVIIKPSAHNTYHNTVDMLDEVSKNKIEKYSVVDITSEEEEFLKKF
jgi:hypothetical protein